MDFFAITIYTTGHIIVYDSASVGYLGSLPVGEPALMSRSYETGSLLLRTINKISKKKKKDNGNLIQ